MFSTSPRLYIFISSVLFLKMNICADLSNFAIIEEAIHSSNTKAQMLKPLFKSVTWRAEKLERRWFSSWKILKKTSSTLGSFCCCCCCFLSQLSWLCHHQRRSFKDHLQLLLLPSGVVATSSDRAKMHCKLSERGSHFLCNYQKYRKKELGGSPLNQLEKKMEQDWN